jgi:hypothetical protein
MAYEAKRWSKDLGDLELQIMELDERLRPIATRPVDITNPEWVRLLTESQHPLDEAGLRSATEALLDDVIEGYQKCEEEKRIAIRKLFATYSSFAWAATLSVAPITDEAFRRHLVLFAIKDQGKDSRDAIIELQDLCNRARAVGVNTAPILRQVAELSSDENKYGMGSTRTLLLGAARHQKLF